MEKIIIVLSGMPASGKDTISNKLHQKDKRYVLLKKYRAIGFDDAPKNGYYNVSLQEFNEKIEKGDFLQFHKRYGRYYGIDIKTLNEMIDCGQIPIIHIGRIENYYMLLHNIKTFEVQNNLSIKIFHIQLWTEKPVLKQRIIKRERTKQNIEKRIAAMEQEYKDAIEMMRKQQKPFTMIIRNSDVNETVNKIIELEQKEIYEDGYEEFWSYLKQIKDEQV